jgi:hypothetical protein
VREDIRREVGQISEKVEVTATAAILQTENAQTGDIISSQQANRRRSGVVMAALAAENSALQGRAADH